MRNKQLLNFYFGAEKLNKYIDGLILSSAVKSGKVAGRCGEFADRIIELIDIKSALGGLWAYLDKVMSGFCGEELATLKFYGAFRRGLSTLPKSTEREVRRVMVKFTRKARLLPRFERAVGLVNEYAHLLRSDER